MNDPVSPNELDLERPVKDSVGICGALCHDYYAIVRVLFCGFLFCLNTIHGTDFFYLFKNLISRNLMKNCFIVALLLLF